MAEPNVQVNHRQPGQRVRDVAAEQPQQRTDYQAGANGTQRVDSAAGPDGQLGPDEISEPDEVVRNNEAKLHYDRPDHSEREGGGDQDIDTAGVNKGIDTEEPE
jgi:hypothetical protein